MYPLKIHLFPDGLSNIEKFPTACFDQEFVTSWEDDGFFQFCVDAIDKCTRVDSRLYKSPVAGYLRVTELSGGTKTLMMAKMFPELKFPISHLGDNCVPALSKLCEFMSTQWYYRGYFPKFPDDLELYIVDTDEKLFGKDIYDWEIFGIPDWANIGYIQEQLRKEGAFD